MRSLPSSARSRFYGLLGILAIAAVVAFGVASYLQVFTPVVSVRVRLVRVASRVRSSSSGATCL